MPYRSTALLAIALPLLVACGPAASRTPPAHAPADAAAADDAHRAFWAWFAGRAPALRTAPIAAAHAEIVARLATAEPKLQAEIADDEVRTLVISADGNRALFPAVERLVARAPSVDGWRVVAFRQPSPIEGESIQIDDVTVALDDIRFVAVPEGSLVALALYIPGYRPDNEILGIISFIALDHAIGEHATETRIGGISRHPASEAPPTARPLHELPALLAATGSH
jgi:hypothetical protein